MDFWIHDRWTFPLSAKHKFPLSEYRLLRERLIADGIAGLEELHVFEALALVGRALRFNLEP